MRVRFVACALAALSADSKHTVSLLYTGSDQVLRSLGLVVLRGTALVLIAPEDGCAVFSTRLREWSSMADEVSCRI